MAARSSVVWKVESTVDRNSGDLPTGAVFRFNSWSQIMKLRTVLRETICLVALSSSFLHAQSDSCANPSAPRIAIIITSAPPPKSVGDEYNYLKRAYDVESRLREALTKQLPGSCIVHDMAILSDPKNFPALKGSLVIMISSRPSFQNPKVAAVAVELSALQGAFFDQSVPIGFLPLLVEDDSDYESGAKAILRFSQGMVKGIVQLGDKKVVN